MGSFEWSCIGHTYNMQTFSEIEKCEFSVKGLFKCFKKKLLKFEGYVTYVNEKHMISFDAYLNYTGNDIEINLNIPKTLISIVKTISNMKAERIKLKREPAYHYESGCFYGECNVLMNDNTLKLIKNLRANDVVYGGAT